MGVLALALACAGCSFNPSALIVVDPSFRADGGARDAGPPTDDAAIADVPATAADAADAGVFEDAAPNADADLDASTPDGPAPDAAAADAQSADATPEDARPDASPDAQPRDAMPMDARPDAAAPDAQPRDAMPGDARPPDAAPDAAAPDAAPDAGPRDSGIDAGTFDGGCAAPPWPVNGTPDSVATIPLSIMPIDTPPLIADFDNDGMEEIAVASRVSGELAIIDWPACSASPSVTVATLFPGASGIALARPTGRDVIITGNPGAFRFATYDGPQQIAITVSMQAAFVDIDGLVVHPSRTEILADGARTGGGFAYIVPRLMSQIRTVADAPVGSPAFLSGLPLNARYAITTVSSLIVAQPDQAADIPFALPVAPTSGPVVLGGEHFSNTTNAAAIAFGARGAAQAGIGVVYLDANNPVTGVVEHVPAPDAPVGEPMPYAEAVAGGPPNAGFFQIRASATMAGAHVLAGCTVVPRVAPMTGHTCVPINAAPMLPGTAPSEATPITAYVSGNNAPDLVVATRMPPRVAFYRPNLTPVGMPVTLNAGATATPALSTTFLSRYNVSGEIIFVPHETSVELVAWRRPAGSGPDSVLWPQSRGGATRSGRL